MKPHSIRLRVRYCETDKMGVIYHGRFLEYFEVGRTSYLEYAGYPYRELEKKGWFFVVTEAHADYRSNTGYDDELDVITTLAWVKHASVRFDYAVQRVQDKRVLATGFTVLACTDGTKVRPMPSDLLQKLQEVAGNAGSKSVIY